MSEQFLNSISAYRLCSAILLKLHINTIGLQTIAVVKSIRRIQVKLQEMIKPNISNIEPRIFWALTVSNNSCKEETLK